MTEALLEELLERGDRSLETAHGHVTCIPGGNGWLVNFRPSDPSAQPASWRSPDAKGAGRLVSALLAHDLALMAACMRDIWLGRDVIDDDYLIRLAELKRRDLVRQTRHGSRVLPTAKGAEVWRAAQEGVAREVLDKAKRKGLGRPYFVVFDAKGKGSAFRDWDRAAAFARHAAERGPQAFAAGGAPEEMVETWQGCMLSPAVLSEVERNGIGRIED